MPLKVFYNSNQSVKDNISYSPSAGKPALVADLFSKNSKVEMVSSFKPLTRKQLKIAHDSSFVDGVLDLKRVNGFGNCLKTVADSLYWTNASFYEAAKCALTDKTVTMSPTSGFHHAEYSSPEGFCTFNGLMIASLLLDKEFEINKITIVDFDAHYGNGAVDIIDQFHIDWIQNYTFGGFADDLLRGTQGRGFDNWLGELAEGKMEEIIKGSDLVLYQAGADPHIDDPYGGYLTTEQMRYRDEIVFKATERLQIPVVWNLAGGYQKPIEKVLELHLNTLNECLKIYKF